MKRLFTAAPAILFLMGCSHLKSSLPQPAPRAREFHFHKTWARHTLNQYYTGVRVNHRMPTLLFGEYVIQGNGVDGIKAYRRKSGHLKWQRNINGGVEVGATLSGTGLYFGANDGFFYALDAYTGQNRWSVPLRAEGLGVPVVDGGIVYFVAGNNMAYALKTDSGEQVWFYNRLDGANLTIRGTAEPTVVGQNILMGFSDGSLVALDKATGAMRWEKRLGTSGRFHDVDTKPVFWKDHIFVASYDGKIYCLKPQNGEVVWSSDDGGFEPVTIQDDIVYTSTSDGRVVALDANSGKKVWEKKLHNTVATAPQFFRGLLIYGEWEGDLVAVDSRNGQDVARYSTGRGITSKPIVDRDAEVAYVMTKNGDLYAFQMGWTNSLEQWAWEKSWY